VVRLEAGHLGARAEQHVRDAQLVHVVARAEHFEGAAPDAALGQVLEPVGLVARADHEVHGDEVVRDAVLDELRAHDAVAALRMLTHSHARPPGGGGQLLP